MKNFLEKLIGLLPHFLFFSFLVAFIYFLNKGLNFEQFLSLIQVLIWPIIISVVLLFFKKVTTYLFFSLEEFGFFGTKGRLKDVREIIEERVQLRLDEEKRLKQQEESDGEFQKKIHEAKASKQSWEQKANENLKLAREIYEMYKNTSVEHEATLKELNILRQHEAERRERLDMMRKRVRERVLRERQAEEDADMEKVREYTDSENTEKNDQ